MNQHRIPKKMLLYCPHIGKRSLGQNFNLSCSNPLGLIVFRMIKMRFSECSSLVLFLVNYCFLADIEVPGLISDCCQIFL